MVVFRAERLAQRSQAKQQQNLRDVPSKGFSHVMSLSCAVPFLTLQFKTFYFISLSSRYH